MAIISSLANTLLIAMPSQKDLVFEKTVIYVCEHREEGSLGLIVNRPTPYSLSLVFEQLGIQPLHVELSKAPLMFGGPIQPERGFVFHKEVGNWRNSLLLQDKVTVTTSNDIIRAIAKDKGPKDFLVTVGYCGWDAHQLDKEIRDNIWLVCPYRAEILYEVPFEERWDYAGSTLGIKMNQLSVSSGHD